MGVTSTADFGSPASDAISLSMAARSDLIFRVGASSFPRGRASLIFSRRKSQRVSRGRARLRRIFPAGERLLHGRDRAVGGACTFRGREVLWKDEHSREFRIGDVRQVLSVQFSRENQTMDHFLDHALRDRGGFPEIDVFIYFQVVILHFDGVVHSLLVDGERAVNEINMLRGDNPRRWDGSEW